GSLLAGIDFLLRTEKSPYQRLPSVTSGLRNGFRDLVHSFRDVDHLSAQHEKVDNFAADSLDNFLRIGWTTSSGFSGQLQAENAHRVRSSRRVGQIPSAVWVGAHRPYPAASSGSPPRGTNHRGSLSKSARSPSGKTRIGPDSW